MTTNKVFVYWNLHRNLWSVKDMITGLVIMRTDALTLENATFKVSETGRQRVLREKRKNVHAGVVGYLYSYGDEHSKHNTIETTRLVSYNPYNGPDFVYKDNGDVIKSARYVKFEPNCKVSV